MEIVTPEPIKQAAWTLGGLFGVVLVIFVMASLGYGVFAGFPYSNASKQKDQTNHTLRTLERTLATLADAEAGQRDFLISGDERFLTPYFAASRRVDGLLDELTDIQSDNGKYFERIEQLQLLKKTKFSDLNDMIVLRRDQGLDAARAFVLADAGKRHMDEMRAVIDEIIETERSHLDGLNLATARWDERRLTAFVLSGAGVLLLATILISRREKLRHRLDIQSLNEEKAELAERLQHVMERMPIGCFMFDVRKLVVYCNPVAESLVGLERWSLYHTALPDSLKLVAWSEAMQKAHDGHVLGHVTHHDETMIEHANGRRLVCEWHYTPLLARDGHIAGHLFMVTDISERRASEDRIKANQQQLAALSRELIAAQVDERKRVAQVLHDQLAQNLAAIKLMVDATLTRVSATPDPEQQARAWQERMPQLGQLLSSSVTDVRELLLELRPPMLEEFGVLASLRLEADRLRSLTGANIVFDSDLDTEIRLAAPTEHVCYLILREALNNAAQHAEATEIIVRSEHTAEYSRYVIEDNGQGFDWARARQKHGHLGLIGMTERASSIGAKLAFHTHQGLGTIVELTLEYST